MCASSSLLFLRFITLLLLNDIREPEQLEYDVFIEKVVEEILGDWLLGMLLSVVKDRVSILTLDYRCSILRIIEEQLILYKHILTEIHWQVLCLVDLDTVVHSSTG